jgi:NAD(P)H dehydrogenase (quinone)
LNPKASDDYLVESTICRDHFRTAESWLTPQSTFSTRHPRRPASHAKQALTSGLNKYFPTANPRFSFESSMTTSNKILVLFDSRSGNVGQMAALLAEGARQVSSTEVRLLHVDDASAEDVLWCDGIAVGSPTNMGLLSWKMKRFWDETMLDYWMKVDGKIACAFSSAGGWGGGMELACQSLLTLLMNFGFLVFGVTEYAAKGLTLHYGAVAAKAPREPDIQESCRILGRRLAEWTACFVHNRKDQHPLVKDLPRMPAS